MHHSTLVDLFRGLAAAARTLWRQPKGPWAVAITVISLAGLEICLALLRHHFPNTWFVAELLVVPIAVLVVALGYAAGIDERPPTGQEFMLAQVGDLLRDKYGLLQKGLVTRAQIKSAILEAMPQIADPMQEGTYIGRVLGTIKISSVWAICGRKSKDHADDFWLANIHSLERPASDHSDNGKYVERVFFPPHDQTEVKDCKTAVTIHLNNAHLGILVRAFNAHRSAKSVFREFGFPAGFGMTIMGASASTNALPRDPTGIAEVLVHWGGIDDQHPHFGVILKEKAWALHFFGLFETIRHGHTQPANAEGNPLQRKQPFLWEDFIVKYPHYANPATAR